MPITRRKLLTAGALLAASVAPAFTQGTAERPDWKVSLFKIITAKDEVVIGISTKELAAMGGADAGSVAKALAERRTLSVWQYAVRKTSLGELEQWPRAKIGLMAHDTLRVEPYATPLKVIAYE